MTHKFLSDENKVVSFRKKWHIYHVTMVNKKKVWKHHIYDFTQKDVVGSLHAQITTVDKSGDKVIYNAEGGFRDKRFIIFEKAKNSDEPTVIHLYPLLGESYHTNHFGIVLQNTWDGDSTLSPSIISRNTLFDISETDTISEEKSCKLDKIWKEEFYRLHKVLPRIIT